MSGPYAEDFKRAKKITDTKTVNDKRHYDVSGVDESFAETHRGADKTTGKTGSGRMVG